MEFPANERRKLQSWIDGHEPTCQVCGQSSFAVYPLLANAVPQFPKEMELAIASCVKCGQVIFFSRRIINALYKSDDADDIFANSLLGDK